MLFTEAESGFLYGTRFVPCERVSDQVRHKPGGTSTEDGLWVEISDLESRRIVLSM